MLVPFAFPLLYGAKFEGGGLACALLMISKLVSLVSGVFVWGLWADRRDLLMLGLLATTAGVSIATNVFIIPSVGVTGAAAVNVASELFLGIAAGVGMWLSARSKQERNTCSDLSGN